MNKYLNVYHKDSDSMVMSTKQTKGSVADFKSKL